MYSNLFFILSILSIVAALPVIRDVWVPQITSPTVDSSWVVGGTYTISWNTDSKPSQVTNPQGMVYLRHGDATQSTPIAQGFPLTAGEVNVTIPADTQPDDNWMVVLFGDSGNWSPPFTIRASSS